MFRISPKTADYVQFIRSHYQFRHANCLIIVIARGSGCVNVGEFLTRAIIIIHAEIIPQRILNACIREQVSLYNPNGDNFNVDLLRFLFSASERQAPRAQLYAFNCY